MKIEDIQIRSLKYEYMTILGYGYVLKSANVKAMYNNITLHCSIGTDKELTNEEIKAELKARLQ